MFTIAVVGAGGMGRTHLNNLRQMPNVQIASICDPNPAIASLAEEIHAGYYADLQQMLSETAAETVLICTPTFLHTQQIEATLRSGRHCISEKPLCLSAREGRELFALARQMKRYLFVAQVLHFQEEYAKLKELVASERYGRVQDAFFYRLSEKPGWLTGRWLFDAQKSGLLPYDLHIHDLDMIVSLFGKPQRAVRQTPTEGCAQQEHCRFLYDYGQMTVCAEASWYNAAIPFEHGYRICFENAVAVTEGDAVVLYKAGEKQGEFLLEPDKAPKNATEINVASALPYQHEIEHFLQCIEEDHPSPVIREENVIAVLETLESMQK